MNKYWISCSKFTCKFTEQNGKIVDSAPIIRKFIGQSTNNLLSWISRKFGEYDLRTLNNE
uniref:Uncharacterized protein n=1 Tax=viral metagenome TaxID=1070528 RepID=A0A6M3IJC9_9ZZZZ